MKHTLWLPILAATAACNDGRTDFCDANPDDPFCTGEYNLDIQIDGFADVEDAADAAIESYDANMCVTKDGRIYVVWRDDREGFSDVWFNKSLDGGRSWLPTPRRVKQGRGNATGVHMTCAGPRVYVVWEDDRDGETGYENIYVNYSTDEGESWLDDDKAIDNDPDGIAISLAPKIAIWEGQVHVVWFDQVEGPPDVYMASSVNGGRKFSEPILVSANEDTVGEYWSGLPEIAIDDDSGRVYVVWEDKRNGRNDIFIATKDASAQAFGPQKRVDRGDDRGSNYSLAPRLGVSEGNAYVVWHDYRDITTLGTNQFRDVFLNFSSDGGENWLGESVRVETDAPGFAESIYPDVLVDGTTAHVVWQDDRNGGYDIYYRSAVDGAFDDSEEGAEIRIERDEQGVANSRNPIIRADGDTMLVGWADLRAGGSEGYNDLYYNFIRESDEEPAWAEEDFRVDSIGAGTSFTEDHDMVVYDGEVYSVWIDGRNGNRDVFFSHTVLGESVDELAVVAEESEAASAE